MLELSICNWTFSDGLEHELFPRYLLFMRVRFVSQLILAHLLYEEGRHCRDNLNNGLS